MNTQPANVDTENLPFKNSKLRYTLISVSTIISYFVLGYLALFLAIPPGFASVVWPSAGIALGVTLIFGEKYWPSILLGSTLTNILISYDATSTIVIIKSLVIAFSIGIGATLQAVIGSQLIKKYTTYPNALFHSRDILKFILIAAILSTMINTTFSNIILWLTQTIAMSELPKSWFVWWTGDAIGVLIFTPALHILFGQPRSLWQSRQILLIPTVIMLGIYTLFFSYYLNIQYNTAQTKFKTLTSQIGSELNNRINNAENTLQSLQQFFLASNFVSRNEFKNYVAKTLKKSPDIQALSWNPIITPETEAKYIHWAKEDGYPDFRINKLEGEELIKDDQRDKYFVVFYIEPEIGNKKALGLNLGSNTIRAIALNKLMSTNEPQATEPLKLAQEISSQHSVILFYPLEKENTPFTNNTHTGNKIQATLSGVYRIRSMMNSFLLSNDNREIKHLFLTKKINITLYDTTNQIKKVPLYNTQKIDDIHRTENPLINKIAWSRAFKFGSRDWVLTVSPSNTFLTSLLPSEIWIVLTLSILFIGVINIFLLIISGEKITSNIRTNKKTQRIKQILRKRQQILEASSEGIIAIDTSGLVTFANEKACEITGFHKKELLGNDLHEITHYQHPNGKKLPKHLCIMHSNLYISETIENELEHIITKDKENVSIRFSKRPLWQKNIIVGSAIYFTEEKCTIKN